MAVAQKYRIPHSVLMDKWDERDTAKAMAQLVEEGSRCSMCGTAEWEWQENKFAYEPAFEHCHGCYLKDKYSEGSENLPGTTTTLIPASQITYESRARRIEQEREQNLEHARSLGLRGG